MFKALSKTFRCPRWKHSFVSCPPPTLDTPLRFSLPSFAITFDLVESLFIFRFDYYIYFIFYHSGRSLEPSWRMGLEAFCMGKKFMEWGAFYLLLLALHSLCIDGYYYCFVFQCITNFALAYRKRGRTDFLLARMVYPIAHRGTHPRNTRGLYTWLWLYCFAFWHLPDGCEVGRRNTGMLLGFGSDSLEVH
ncbi:hypothetical protein ASPVEDRAFT_561072 [Aspergillus versicolor CBS 583.65]|uniref:Uncharacterized protein n=1 Tax=Aspergillus versicolor CBS 583.65 TaxID=1036611 RepID=A0A1L9PFV1_ASPVE|nr:uncharacterized protein ASPVEDRAFT_561072 [Aspergillus versicolor CBS 583.65]OJJ00335.1 hypothetical protein ASPVEDRAFT_561072 [Aspergillus versicolor CBS 583.65]